MHGRHPSRRYSQLIGFDDAPFARGHRGDVPIVAAVYARERLEGVLTGKVRRDGVNSTPIIASMIEGSRFRPQLQAVLLQGIALAGFNVVDIHGLHERLRLPVLAIARAQPDLPAIHSALLDRVPGGRRKWQLIERAGAMEPCEGVWVQRAGIDIDETAELIAGSAINGKLPEPLRTAHLIAGGIVNGESRHRA